MKKEIEDLITAVKEQGGAYVEDDIHPSLCENISREDVTACITVGYRDFYPTVA